jgi:hypothetical protein
MSVATEAEPIRLSPLGRAWRVVLVLLLTAGFLAGSVVGQDDWWPFSPWRMFSTSTAPSASVVSLRIDVQSGADRSWQPASLNPHTVGLNRAEVEGRIPEITSHPEMLGTLAHSHSRLRPDEPAWRAIRVVRHEVQLANRAPTGVVRDTTLAQWSAP